MTTELGRQPWTIYGLLRTADSASPLLTPGNVLFSLLGFAGMYTLISTVWLVVMAQEIARGPEEDSSVAQHDLAVGSA